jgi:hypothetical protein
MGVFNSNNVKIGPGTLYAAPIGTSEPVSVTGAWPAGWTPLGYTDQGSSFQFGPQVAAVMVEEEFWPLQQAVVSYSGKLDFVLAETTRQNLLFALNAGIGSSTVSAAEGSNGDGSLWAEPPAQGTEVRVMLGWDSLPEAATAGNDPVGRLIVRKALQVGQVTRLARKGNNKSMYACSFALEKPTGVQPFRFLFEPNLNA